MLRVRRGLLLNLWGLIGQIEEAVQPSGARIRAPFSFHTLGHRAPRHGGVPSPDDVKPCEGSFGLLPLHFDPIDVRLGRAMSAPSYDGFYGASLPFEDSLHPAVAQVAHPAPQAVALRLAPRVLPEIHPLNHSRHPDMGARLLRHNGSPSIHGPFEHTPAARLRQGPVIGDR